MILDNADLMKRRVNWWNLPREERLRRESAARRKGWRTRKRMKEARAKDQEAKPLA